MDWEYIVLSPLMSDIMSRNCVTARSTSPSRLGSTADMAADRYLALLALCSTPRPDAMTAARRDGRHYESLAQPLRAPPVRYLMTR
jgi:hypothetical protein